MTQAQRDEKHAGMLAQREIENARKFSVEKWRKRSFSVLENASTRARYLKDAALEREAAEIQARIETMEDEEAQQADVRARVTAQLMLLAVAIAQAQSLVKNVVRYH